ncbi:MAG: phosphoglucosamine mutase [Planctomycetes bacterium]|nr:phosphoglucosamine mutase [Planctomycetota bacterium]
MSRALDCVVSVSGIRGVVGQNLDVDQVMALAAAYGVAIASGGSVVLGRDSRPTGSMFAQACAAGLRSVGCSVVDIGLVPTPTVPIMIAHLGAAGGIQISASHNPVEWNALKFFNRDGRNIDQAQLDRLLAEYRTGSTRSKRWDGCGGYRVRDDALDIHLERVIAAVDADLVRTAGLTVVIDSVNGAGSELGPRLLSRLGCRVVPVFCRPDLVFPRDPEPTAANVRQTGGIVAGAGAQIGFVQDPDADRLAIIDDQGSYIGEEYTLVLCAAGRLGQAAKSGATGLVACTNLSTSRMLEDVASRHGATVVRSKVGEAHVVDAMQRHGAVIGGEGNGGVIDPRVVWGRDSHIGMALVLEHLARSGGTTTAAVADIPRYAMHKEKVAMDRAAVSAAVERLRTHPLADGAQFDTNDGLKVIWPDRWVHLRASGTEPASRIIAEAPSADAARDLAVRVREAIGARLVTAH